jgi:hypothetical protein
MKITYILIIVAWGYQSTPNVSSITTNTLATCETIKTKIVNEIKGYIRPVFAECIVENTNNE